MRSDMGMSLGAHRSERDQQPPDFRAFKLSVWSLHCRHQEPGRRPRDTLYRDSDYAQWVSKRAFGAEAGALPSD
ncbi:hypothetical protein JMJ78_0008974 [Colletotrichum scovillei]|nr:hypothetical protein JMJ78_0008974 [Colletotrichum scovillei]